MDEIRSFEGFKAWEAVISKLNGGDEMSRTPGGAQGGSEKSRAERLYG